MFNLSASQSEWLPLLLIISGASLFVLFALCIFLLRQTSRLKKFDKTTDEITQSISQLNQRLHETQHNLDSKLSHAQQQLFQQMLDDREKQLSFLSELRINLEKRFAESKSQLSDNIQEFKVELVERFEKLQRAVAGSLSEGQQSLIVNINNFAEKINQVMESYQNQTREAILDNFRKGIKDIRSDLDRSIHNQNQTLEKNLKSLSETTDNRLKEISGQVEKRLGEGFEKTTKTFNDVIKRLALIDDAQKKITELSTNVVSLQEVLNDKRSRGAFGEIQLKALVSNVIPEAHYQMQKTLSNNKVVDCLLLLPEPTGKIAIDAKFPLESYKKMMDVNLGEQQRIQASRQFARDIKKHVNDIAEKYILPPETCDGAVMFIPAESIFAEIHGHHPDLVEYAYKAKVWLVSPTTLMAILTTASTVIKDEKTRQQVHIIQQHLSDLGKDFGRFQTRMDNLSRHIGLVSKDVKEVHTSAAKISNRFGKIERVEIAQEEQSQPSAIIASINKEPES